MAPWEVLSRLEEVVWGGRVSRWKGKAGCAGPPHPEEPRGSRKGVENRWSG